MRLGVEAALVDGQLVPGDVEIADGRIARVGLGGAGSGIAVPGFVDLHVHGFGGVDFATADAEGYGRATEALLETGVTSFQPTFVTAPEERARRVAARGAEVGARLPSRRPVLSSRRLGMHPESARRDPDLALLERLLAAGPVAHVTLAPELDGALELVDVLRERGITAACGHTDATAEQAHAAFDRGATHVTHLFNAMRPFAHRDPGIAGAALARDDVTVELILDGNHVADDTARVAWRAAHGRVVLVTDGMAATGIGDGDWNMGAVEVEVRDGVVRRRDGALAGSVLTIPEAIRNLVRIGATFEEAVDAATRVPRVPRDDRTSVSWRRVREQTSSSSTPTSRCSACSSAESSTNAQQPYRRVHLAVGRQPERTLPLGLSPARGVIVHARVATFQMDPASFDQAIGSVRADVESGEAPAGLEGAKMLMLVDRETERARHHVVRERGRDEARRRGAERDDPGSGSRTHVGRVLEVPVSGSTDATTRRRRTPDAALVLARPRLKPPTWCDSAISRASSARTPRGSSRR